MTSAEDGSRRLGSALTTMLTSALLAISTILLALLSLYGMGYVLGALRFLFVAKERIPTPAREDASVTVLVPAFDEGAALVDTVETLLHQDYGGPIHVRVLIEDESDTSFEPLRDTYSLGESLTLRRGHITLELCLTGLQRKHAKINQALAEVDSTYVAFLDADHRAEPSWLRASVAVLEGGDDIAVQSRRGPLEARTLFQFWDSAENHLGNEVFNHLFRATKLTSFFTGTTCVFRARAFADRGLPDSITEDTYLSYDLLCEGETIAYNGSCGSFEEVAPDFGTYVARRRRWSSGHNQTFFAHLPQLLRRGHGLRRRLQLLFHGAYFLVPTLVVALLNVVGLYFFLQLTNDGRALSFILSLLLAGGLSLLISPNLAQWLQNLALAFVYVFPQVAGASVFAYRFVGDEIYFQIISFPYARISGPLGLGLLLAPLVVLLVGAARLRRPSLGTTLLFLPTFPLVLFLDIFAAYIGLADHLLGRTVWGRIRRSNSIEASFLPPEVAGLLSASSGGIRWARVIGAGLSLLVGIVAVNDLFVVDNCGHPEYLLGAPIVYRKTDFDTRMTVRVRKRPASADELEIAATVDVASKGTQAIAVAVRLGDTVEDVRLNGAGTATATTRAPLGFDTLDLRVDLAGAGSTCRVERSVDTTLREVRQGKLHVNGEEFLIKGVVPSFRTARVDLELREGLEQIKALGANTIRVYHAPTEELLDLAEELDLMLVVQPDRSTWQDIDMTEEGSAEELLGRYEALVAATEGRPHILIDNAGNELELVAEGAAAPRNIATMLRGARASESYRFPLSYSTYAVYHDYPVDLLAVNMLDSGETYWRDAVELVRAKHDAFYASEFGGFVAFYETIDPLLRAYRIDRNWRRLAEAGSSGVIFFQSHDNWAQPVVVGFNDPFNPEQPDDLRGVWDHENRPKLIHEHLKTLYADVVIQLEGPPDAIQVTLRNRRPYILRAVHVDYGGGEVFAGQLAPGERVVLDHALAEEDTHRFDVRHTSHRGLTSAYRVEVRDPAHLARPYVTNRFARVGERSASEIEIELYGEDELRFFLPASWERYRVNGQEVEASPGLQSFRFPHPGRVACAAVQRLDVDQKLFVPLPRPFVEGGPHTLRVQLPELPSYDDYSLVFEGTGASALSFVAPDDSKITVRTHSYRENRIPMRTLAPALHDQVLFVQLVRDSTYYVVPELTPEGEPIVVRWKRPWLEKIHRTVLQQAGAERAP